MQRPDAAQRTAQLRAGSHASAMSARFGVPSQGAAASVDAVMKPLLLCLLAVSLLIHGGCANRPDSDAGGDRIHGSIGVRSQSRDTSRFANERAPF